VRAVIATGDGWVDVVEATKPQVVHDTDAVVRVTRAAICGTDLGLLRVPGALTKGTRLGHEFVGVVESVGRRVRLAPGTRVFAGDYSVCGACWWCRHGDHWHCDRRQFFGTGGAFGEDLAGGQAEFVRVPNADVTLAELPDRISDDDGVFLGDLVPTGWAAIDRARLAPGEVVVVSGGGPVGQIASLIAQARGAGPVIVSEPDARRRDLAARLGALVCEPAAVGDLARQITAGRGADIVLDCVGGQAGLAAALGAVRSRGRVSSVGVPHGDRWDAPVRELFEREISVSFVVGDAIRDRDAYLGLVEAELLTPSEIVSRTLPLDRAVEGYATAAEMADVKVLLAM
jgi:threonine dehydrogenase-like Zn-dependent dehydrogenase